MLRRTGRCTTGHTKQPRVLGAGNRCARKDQSSVGSAVRIGTENTWRKSPLPHNQLNECNRLFSSTLASLRKLPAPVWKNTGEGRRGCWRYLGGIAIVYPIGHTPNSSDTGRESFAFPKSTNEKIARDSYLPVLQAVLVIWPQSEARSGFGVRIALSRGGRRMP